MEGNLVRLMFLWPHRSSEMYFVACMFRNSKEIKGYMDRSNIRVRDTLRHDILYSNIYLSSSSMYSKIIRLVKLSKITESFKVNI